MVDAHRRPPAGRFPSFILLLVAGIVGCEYFFGTLQVESTVRGSRSSQSSATIDDNVLDTMVNETIDMLLTRISKGSGNADERIATLERKVSSLEASIRAARTSKTASSPQQQQQVMEEVDFYDGDENVEDPLCVKWKVDMDEWWTHHPDWYVSHENKSHYCFSRIEDEKKAQVFKKLYNVQFKTGDCSNVITKPMWSSGWGADFTNVVDGLKYAFETGTPVQMHVMEGAWHYSGKKDASKPVCETKDMYCYFLPLTRCAAIPERPSEEDFLASEFLELESGTGRWLLEFAARPQTWLRREVYKLSQKAKLTTPCTAIHVRRSDVVLHEEHARKYRKIEEYLKALDKDDPKNILLLTDDQNAVEEARTLHPDYNWMYLHRPRHRGAEGGWENQIPSDDPRLEVIILLAIFKLVRQCSTLIHTHSNFAKVLQGEMEDAMNGKDFHRVNLDDGNPTLFNANNSMSVNISLPFPSN